MRSAILVAAVFLACAVEMVEALTIVLAVALTRGWRSVRLGIGAALFTLAVVVALLGPALTVLPLDVLRVVVGFLLLAFGLQWLRKAVLRSAGYLPLHDEDRIFEREVAATRIDSDSSAGEQHDWYAFTLSFKGVFLEGLEVAFIVVTFGAAHHDFPLIIGAALAALLVVVSVGVVVHHPLSRVPENTLKFGVGLMLVSFGTFWGAEGTGAAWPGGDAALLALIALYTSVAFLLVGWLRHERASRLMSIRESA
jgi:uncharacterized membrane protein